jgi:hypothetical protein
MEKRRFTGVGVSDLTDAEAAGEAVGEEADEGGTWESTTKEIPT